MGKLSKPPNRSELEKEYKAQIYTFEKILTMLCGKLKNDLESMGLHPTIKSRVKTFDSYFKKLLRLLSKKTKYNGALEIYDLLGVRIVCPFLDNLQIIENYVKQKYDVVQIECKGSDQTFREFGYRSTHFLIHVPEKMLQKCRTERPMLCEIQLHTILQDAWSEVEHELIYKTEFSPFDEPMKRKLAALNANLTLSDTLFQEIRDYQRKLQNELDKRRESFMHQVRETPANPALTMRRNDGLSDVNLNEQRGAGDFKVMDGSVDDLLVDALIAHNKGQFGKAITIYSLILKRELAEHIKSIIYIHRGMAYFAQAHYSKALKDFTVSIKFGPDNHRAFYYRGLTHEVEQNYQKALEDFTACLALKPYQFEPLYSRAQLYSRLKDYPKAIADCNLALKIEPSARKVKQLRKTLMSC